MSYALYHTLNKNIEDKPFKKVKSLQTKLQEITDNDSKIAVIMLIAEHSRVEGLFDTNTENPVLPYGMTQKDKDVTMDIEKFPDDLKWILWKFVSRK